MNNNFIHVGNLVNEQCAALTVECLNHKYPNVYFEAIESNGVYDVQVKRKYTDNVGGGIHPHTLNMFQSSLFEIYEIVGVVMNTLEKFDALKK